jgi:hypothetical protein
MRIIVNLVPNIKKTGFECDIFYKIWQRHTSEEINNSHDFE